MGDKKTLQDRLEYLDSVITYNGDKTERHIFTSKNNDADIEYQLIVGSVHQVLTSKFGFDYALNHKISVQWCKAKRKKQK